MCSWGKFWTNDTKRLKKNPLPLLKNQEQKQGVASRNRVLSMPPALNTSSGVGRTSKPLFWPDPRA